MWTWVLGERRSCQCGQRVPSPSGFLQRLILLFLSSPPEAIQTSHQQHKIPTISPTPLKHSLTNLQATPSRHHLRILPTSDRDPSIGGFIRAPPSALRIVGALSLVRDLRISVVGVRVVGLRVWFVVFIGNVCCRRRRIVIVVGTTTIIPATPARRVISTHIGTSV